MVEFDLQASRMLWAPSLRPQGALIAELLNERFSDYLDNWRFGLLQQQASVSTSGNFLLMDIDEAKVPGSEQFGAVVTQILGRRNGGTASTATISFGTNSANFDNWHTGIDISNVDTLDDWFIVHPYPDNDGVGSDTPAGAIKKVRTADTSHDEFRVRNTGGTWGSTIDFWLFGYYWREAS